MGLKIRRFLLACIKAAGCGCTLLVLGAQTHPAAASTKELNINQQYECRIWTQSLHNSFNRIFPSFLLSASLPCNTLQMSPNNGQKLLSLTFEPLARSDSQIELLVVEQPHPDAIAQMNTPQTATIILSSGLLRSMADLDELAFVLAHEMSHILKGHHRTGLPPTLLTASQQEHLSDIRREWEYVADYSALELLHRAGFSPSRAIGFLYRFAAAGPEALQPKDQLHPSLYSRLQLLEHLSSIIESREGANQ